MSSRPWVLFRKKRFGKWSIISWGLIGKRNRVNADFAKEEVREETRAEEVLKTKMSDAQNIISPSAYKKLDSAPLAVMRTSEPI